MSETEVAFDEIDALSGTGLGKVARCGEDGAHPHTGIEKEKA